MHAEGIKIAALIIHVLAAQLCAICPSSDSQAGCRTIVYMALALESSAGMRIQLLDLHSLCLLKKVQSSTTHFCIYQVCCPTLPLRKGARLRRMCFTQHELFLKSLSDFSKELTKCIPSSNPTRAGLELKRNDGTIAAFIDVSLKLNESYSRAPRD